MTGKGKGKAAGGAKGKGGGKRVTEGEESEGSEEEWRKEGREGEARYDV